MRYFFKLFIGLLLISQLSSSCRLFFFARGRALIIGEEVAVAATERNVFLRSIGVSRRVALAENALVIENESLFFSQLARVRMTKGTILRNPRLYVLEGGIQTEFASVRGTTEFGKTAVRFLKNGIEVGEEYSLPGRLYKVNSRSNLVNVRSGRGENYGAYTHKVMKDQIILVMEEHPIRGWYKVKTGVIAGEEFISAALLLLLNSKETETKTGISEPTDYLLICQSDTICNYLNNIQDVLSFKGFTTKKNGFVSYLPANEELKGYYKKVVLLNGSISTLSTSIDERAISTTLQFTLRVYDVKERKYVVSNSDKIIVIGFSEAENLNKLQIKFSEKMKPLL